MSLPRHTDYMHDPRVRRTNQQLLARRSKEIARTTKHEVEERSKLNMASSLKMPMREARTFGSRSCDESLGALYSGRETERRWCRLLVDESWRNMVDMSKPVIRHGKI